MGTKTSLRLLWETEFKRKEWPEDFDGFTPVAFFDERKRAGAINIPRCMILVLRNLSGEIAAVRWSTPGLKMWGHCAAPVDASEPYADRNMASLIEYLDMCLAADAEGGVLWLADEERDRTEMELMVTLNGLCGKDD